MTVEEKIEIIRSNELFASLPTENLIEIVNATDVKKIPAGTVFIEQDTLDTVVYFVCEGKVKIFRATPDGEEVLLSMQGKGLLLGEMSLLNNYKRAASVSAYDELVVLTLSAVDFLKVLYLFPEISISLLKYFARRIYELGHETETMLVKNLTDRVFFALEKLSEMHGSKEVSISFDDLALIVGSTRDRIVESLKNLQEDGKIIIESGRFVIS
jgi:CRP/FNR family transcriptional regulator, cyclic AMP receptor protein